MDNDKINQNILRKKTLFELHQMLKCKIITISTSSLKSYNPYLQPPYMPIGTLPQSELNLDVIQNSDTFAVWDAVDGVIALAWENINAYDSYPEKRLCFKFGEPIKDVETKLYEKDLILNYNKQYHEK